MSMIFGIFNRNGSPVEKTDIDDMYSAISYYPHEKYNYKIVENIAFGHLLTYNTPESLFEEQPVFLNDQELFFVFEGRIDNREELVSLLNINIKNNLTDGEIALRAWIKWEKESCDKIFGDWSFANFNFKTQKFFISRDHHGYTDINYYCDDKRFVFASSIKSILTLKFIKKELDTDNIISTLAIFGNGRKDRTYYKNIYKLNPAHYLLIDRKRLALERYWFPENIQIQKNKKPNEYVEEFENILNHAVKVRLRSYKPVCSMLSGGLDSGTVSYIAAEIMKKENKKLTTYSHIPLYQVSENINNLRFGDESPYIRATAEASKNIDPIYLKSENISVLDGIMETINILNSPIHAGANTYWLVDIIKSSSDDGFGTILTGEHGNATISFSGYEEIIPFYLYLKQSGLKNAIKKRIIKPIIKKTSPKLYNFLKKSPQFDLEKYSYLNLNTINTIRKEMNEQGYSKSLESKLNSHQDLSLRILMPGYNPRCYFGGAFSDYFGIEMRDPTADKRVIENLLKIPNEMFFSENGNNKYLIRKMMKNKLPDKVLFTNKKGLQSADIGLRIKSNKKEIGEALNELCKSDYVSSIINTEKLKNDWTENINLNHNKYDPLQVQSILRVLMSAKFMLEHNKL